MSDLGTFENQITTAVEKLRMMLVLVHAVAIRRSSKKNRKFSSPIKWARKPSHAKNER